jgi:hypothetical protein
LEVRRDETHLLYNSYFGPEGHADVHDLGVIILEELVVEITPATLPTEGFLDAMKTEGTLRFGAVLGRDENVPSPRGETVTRTNNEAANLRGSHRPGARNDWRAIRPFVIKMVARQGGLPV